MHEYVHLIAIIRNKLKSGYSLGWGKYSEAMEGNIRSIPVFHQGSDEYKVIMIAKLIQVETFNFEKHTYIFNLMKYIQ